MRRQLTLLASLVLTVSLVGVADATSTRPPFGTADGVNEQQSPGQHSVDDGIIDTPLEEHRTHGHDDQHGPDEGHIPGPLAENVEQVGVWTAPRTNKKPGRITDVWSLGNFAYLGTFAPPCSGLGVNVVDISDPENPQKAAFIPSRPGTRVNDVKVFHFDGLASGFTGDLLLHSNENCNTNPQRVGGISLWDVTDPTNAQPLARGVGDNTTTDNEGNVVTLPRARQVHNIFAWQDGDEAYAAIVDDEELLDVDILEITDPSNPVHVAETGLPDWPTVVVDGFGDDAFVHDIWFDIVDGTPQLLLSYWDAGWIRLDVSDAENPTIIDPPGDSDYPDPDPFTGFSPQEGNAHAGVWDWTGELILAGDEDQSPFRLTPLTVTEQTTDEGGVPDQPVPGTEYDAGEFGFTVPIDSIDDGILNGPVVFGGYGCAEDADDIPPASVLDPFLDPTAASPEERILVTQRGPVDDPNADFPGCFFSDKIRNGEEKGYDAVIIANHHTGAGEGASPDAFICGGQGSPVLGLAHGLCTGHRALHELFGRTPDYQVPYPVDDPDDLEPNPGDVGPKLEVEAEFDGRGPFHLLDHESLEEIDAFAPPEVHDPAFATGFGELTMHNVEADPTRDLAYISWYALGFRVLDFSACTSRGGDGDFSNQDQPGCVQQVGAFIDDGGNDFWGIHQALDHPTDPDVILLSDRDRGLYLLKFTG